MEIGGISMGTEDGYGLTGSYCDPFTEMEKLDIPRLLWQYWANINRN